MNMEKKLPEGVCLVLEVYMTCDEGVDLCLRLGPFPVELTDVKAPTIENLPGFEAAAKLGTNWRPMTRAEITQYRESQDDEEEVEY